MAARQVEHAPAAKPAPRAACYLPSLEQLFPGYALGGAQAARYALE